MIIFSFHAVLFLLFGFAFIVGLTNLLWYYAGKVIYMPKVYPFNTTEFEKKASAPYYQK